MTRRELEDLSGISVRQIAYLENDQKDPRRETLVALAEVFGAELLEAAFPGQVTLGRFRKSPTARLLGEPDWGSVPDPAVLVPVGA